MKEIICEKCGRGQPNTRFHETPGMMREHIYSKADPAICNDCFIRIVSKEIPSE